MRIDRSGVAITDNAQIDEADSRASCSFTIRMFRPFGSRLSVRRTKLCQAVLYLDLGSSLFQGLLIDVHQDHASFRAERKPKFDQLLEIVPTQKQSPLFHHSMRGRMPGPRTRPYRFEATTIEGFVQQVAVQYVARGYWFYVSGIVPEAKKAARSPNSRGWGVSASIPCHAEPGEQAAANGQSRAVGDVLLEASPETMQAV